MNKKYENSIHRLGRVGVIIGISFMLGIPAIVSAVYKVWPENIGKLLTACVGLLAIYIPTNSVQWFPFLYILTNTCYFLFDNSHSNSYEAIFIVVFICISLMPRDVKYLLMYLFAVIFFTKMIT